MKGIQPNNTKRDKVCTSTQPRPPGGKRYLHLVIAALTCPCHVPIYLAIFGGTALGAFLQENLLLFILALTVIFFLALGKGLRLGKLREKSDRSNVKQG